MNKAKDSALKAYPIKMAEREGYDENLRERKGFVKGYHKAEKDLELTWEDIKVIEKLLGFDIIIEPPKEFYQDVLKRFKESKK